MNIVLTTNVRCGASLPDNIEVKFKLFLLSGKSRNSFYLLHIRIKTNVTFRLELEVELNFIVSLCFASVFFFLSLKDESNQKSFTPRFLLIIGHIEKAECFSLKLSGGGNHPRLVCCLYDSNQEQS